MVLRFWAFYWLFLQVKSKSDDPPEKDEGSPKARKALALIGSGLGEAYPAVSGANVVELMAKVMKVRVDGMGKQESIVP